MRTMWFLRGGLVLAFVLTSCAPLGADTVADSADKSATATSWPTHTPLPASTKSAANTPLPTHTDIQPTAVPTVTPTPEPTVTPTATATITPVPPTCEPTMDPAAQAGMTENASIFEIVAAESQARFIIDEVLDRKPNTVIGETNQISGNLTVDMANPSLSKVGPISIAARTLRSDGSLRDYSIHWFILVTRKYETIEFVPISIGGLPERVELGKLVTFRICGDLKIRQRRA